MFLHLCECGCIYIVFVFFVVLNIYKKKNLKKTVIDFPASINHGKSTYHQNRIFFSHQSTSLIFIGSFCVMWSDNSHKGLRTFFFFSFSFFFFFVLNLLSLSFFTLLTLKLFHLLSFILVNICAKVVPFRIPI